MLITNDSPLGDLEIPLLGRIVAAGETVDVSDEHAEILLAQHNVFIPGDQDAQDVAERHAAARDAGLPAFVPGVELPAPAEPPAAPQPPAEPAAPALVPEQTEAPAEDPADTEQEHAE